MKLNCRHDSSMLYLLKLDLFPEPPKFAPASVVINSASYDVEPKSPVKKTATKFVPKMDQGVIAEDIVKMARNLRSVKKPKDLPDNITREVEKKEEKEEQQEEVKIFKPSFMSARAMFEGGAKQPLPNRNTSWNRSDNTSVKQSVNNAAPKTTTQASKIEEKGPVDRQTSWNRGGMSFRIVETSATFK